LRDGQIVEQGNHKELLKLDGIFAKMWADQVNADRRAQSLSSPTEVSGLGLIIDDIVPQVAGYDIEPALLPPPQENAESGDVVLNTGTLVEEPDRFTPSIRESIVPAETEQTTDAQVTPEERGALEAEEAASPGEAPKTYAQVTSANVEQPKETGQPDEPTSTPIAFPSAGDDGGSSKPTSIAATPSGGITFSPEVNSPPSRSGTPDPDAGPKRKRISSQNFQRLAKKITMVRRNSSSASIDPEASTSSLESPAAGGSKPRKAKLKRKSTGPPPVK
jgi:hypothetical protein